MGKKILHVPVLVSGGGSVGLSLAAEFGWRNVECMVVEQNSGLNMHPRANAVANRTMEYYRRWGIDQEIVKAGIPPELPANYFYISTLSGRILHGINLPPFSELEKLTRPGGYAKEEHSWSPYLKTITGQHEVEKAILDYVRQCDSVDFSFDLELIDFEETGHGVLCTIRDNTDDTEQKILCQYLVACDGGRSMVRQKLGIGLSGRANLAKFVSLYFRAPDLVDQHSFGHANIFFPCHRDHRGFLLNWDGGTTYTYHVILDEGQNWDDIDPVEAIEGLLGASTPVDILSIQPWTAHALVADQYSRGRIFLAGDAAHLFTPTGGFGMNTGVSDVIELAWKIQASLEGWAGPRLLESYGKERKPIGIRNTMEAADCFDRLASVMNEGDILDEEGPLADQVRARLKEQIVQQEKLIVSSGTLLGYRHNNSGIIIPDGTPEPPDHPRQYIPTARPGHRAPHIWLKDGTSVLDHFFAGFTLLITGPAAENPDPFISEFEKAAAGINLPLSIVTISEPGLFELYEQPLTLIRPDLMVAWRGDHTGEGAETILNVVRGG